MGIISKKFAAPLIILGLTAFVSLGIFGLGHFAGMPMSEDGEMEGCIFTGKIMLCKMNVIEHINLWLSMFTAAPQESAAILALLVLLTVVIFVTKNILVPLRLSKRYALAHKMYLAGHPNLPLFNHLKKAFSQGILNPKIY